MISFNSRIKKLAAEKKSWLCVGLDIDPDILGDYQISNLKKHTFKVIDATRDYAVSYKPNFAFFERWGSIGFKWLEETVKYIGDDHIKIADAKRGDIGNTVAQYAQSIFYHFGFDSVTINPYMGTDSILPFIKNPDKGAFVLCRTSNDSSGQLQDKLVDNIPLYEHVAKLVNDLNVLDNIGLVVGATACDELLKIRNIVPDLPILMPGVGAQGGNLSQSLNIGNQAGIGIINISRAISFAGDMSQVAIRSAAHRYVEQMREAIV